MQWVVVGGAACLLLLLLMRRPAQTRPGGKAYRTASLSKILTDTANQRWLAEFQAENGQINAGIGQFAGRVAEIFCREDSAGAVNPLDNPEVYDDIVQNQAIRKGLIDLIIGLIPALVNKLTRARDIIYIRPADLKRYGAALYWPRRTYLLLVRRIQVLVGGVPKSEIRDRLGTSSALAAKAKCFDVTGRDQFSQDQYSALSAGVYYLAWPAELAGGRSLEFAAVLIEEINRISFRDLSVGAVIAQPAIAIISGDGLYSEIDP